MGVHVYNTKKGKRYLAKLVINKVVVKTQGGFKTKRAATTWMLTERDQYKEEVRVQKEADITFYELVQEYLDECKQLLKPRTYRYKVTVLGRFITFLDGAEPDRQAVKDFVLLTKNEVSNVSANKYLVEIVSVFNWLIKEEKYKYANPAANINRFPTKKYVRYIPTKEDIDKVLDVAEGWQKDFVTMLYHTAARLSEIRLLKWEDVDLNRGTLTLWTSKRKGGNMESRTQAATKTVLEILYRRKALSSPDDIYVFTNPHTGKRYHKNTGPVRELFKKLCDKAGVKLFTAHCLRHYIATHLTETNRIGIRETQRLLGHQNISTTEKYLQELALDKSLTHQIEDLTDTKNLNSSGNGSGNGTPIATTADN